MVEVGISKECGELCVTASWLAAKDVPANVAPSALTPTIVAATRSARMVEMFMVSPSENALHSVD
jgi:N-acetylmuramic acid 6-phosphate (MurNAc-6-P) etherase